MRVLHVYSGNLFGGIESMLVTLARERDGCPAMTPEFALVFEGRLAAALADAGAVVHALPEARFSRPLTIRRTRAALERLLASRSFDRVVCHAAWSQAVLGPPVRRAGRPLVFWAHDALTGRHWIERLARRVPPDVAVANSRFTAATLPALFPGIPAAVVHPPVDIDAFARAAEDRAAARAEVRAALATPEDDVVIVQASRLEAWKGHRALLGALARTRARTWTAWIAGGAQRPAETAYRAELEALVDRLGLRARVRFLGERDDLPRVLAAADVMCQPNERPEPFGLALVEGLAAGLPVVTAPLGGAADIVTDACGRLAPPADSDALAAALDALVEDGDLRARLAGGALARARAVADPGRQLRALHATLTRMAAVRVPA